MEILILEDDFAIAMGLEYALKNEGYAVTVCNTVAQAKEAIEKNKFSLYILT